MASPVWLIDIEAGTTWRFATRRIVYAGSVYADGLETSGSFGDALSFSVPSESVMPITISAQAVPLLDTEDVSMGATATVRYWRDPDGDAPVVVLSGPLEDPEYGGPDEPLTASVREVPWDDHGKIPQATARINDDTWPNRDTLPDIEDEFYPLVIGEPGVASAGVYGSPAYYVLRGATDYVLIAQHPVLASTVTIHDETGPSSASLSVLTVLDGLGRSVSVANASAWASLDAGDELWAVWDGGGGLANPEAPSDLLTGAGDVIEYILHRSTIRVDWGRLRAAKMRLNAYRIDTYIQADPGERVTPWDWIVDQLLPILPVSVRTGPDGIYLTVFDPGTPNSSARGALEEGRNCDRVSAVSVVGTSDVANDYSLSYAPRANKDKGSLVVRVTGSQETLDAYSGAVASSICVESVRRYGVISREVSTSAVYDTATATKILMAMAARDSLPSREVVYVLDDGSLTDLEPGDTVSVTDSSLGWRDRTLYVWSVRVADEREVTLRMWHQAGRDYRSNV